MLLPLHGKSIYQYVEDSAALLQRQTRSSIRSRRSHELRIDEPNCCSHGTLLHTFDRLTHVQLLLHGTLLHFSLRSTNPCPIAVHMEPFTPPFRPHQSQGRAAPAAAPVGRGSSLLVAGFPTSTSSWIFVVFSYLDVDDVCWRARAKIAATGEPSFGNLHTPFSPAPTRNDTASSSFCYLHTPFLPAPSRNDTAVTISEPQRSSRGPAALGLGPPGARPCGGGHREHGAVVFVVVVVVFVVVLVLVVVLVTVSVGGGDGVASAMTVVVLLVVAVEVAWVLLVLLLVLWVAVG